MSLVADVITQELVAQDVHHFFLLTGGDHQLFVALKRAGIHQILARSEDAAVYMADAYARLKQSATWVYGQYGPGAANIAGSLAEPLWSSSPVIALTSSMRRQHRYRLEYQELDQTPLFTSVTKWQAEVSMPEQVPHLLRAAVLHALTGTPGPVYIGLPNDLTGAPIDKTLVPDPVRKHSALQFPLFRPEPPADSVDRAMRLLRKAQRPMVLVGNGVHASTAYEPLLRLVETLNIPVVTSASGKGVIPEDHALSAGVAGRYSRRYTNECLVEADVILAVGSRLGGLVTDSYRLITPGCTVIQIDINQEVIGHNFPVEVGIAADARAALSQLAEAAADDRSKPETQREQWVQHVTALRKDWHRRFAERASRSTSPMQPESLVKVLQQVVPPDGLVIADTGYASAWVSALYEVRRAGKGLLRSDGSLGWAFPAALGAKLAVPDRPVIAVTGDGGFGYHIGELETAIRLRLPVVVIVLNNQSLAFEHHLQQLLYGEPVSEVDDFVDVDHAAVARAYGAEGYRVKTADEFREALQRALVAERVVIIDALIDKQAIAPVTRYDAIRTREL